MTATPDLLRLKNELLALKSQDAQAYKTLIHDVEAGQEGEIKKDKDVKLDEFIDNHFAKYEDVFKALA